MHLLRSTGIKLLLFKESVLSSIHLFLMYQFLSSFCSEERSEVTAFKWDNFSKPLS